MSKFYPVAEPDIGEREEELLLDAFRSGWISSLGEYIDKFEDDFAKFCESPHGVAVSNGTVALHLTLKALNIGPGDEVILPSLTFVATAAAVKHAGAEPVFVDCEADIGIINPAAVAHAVTNKTKAIIAVHLYGHPADMDALRAISEKGKIYLIEDAAEAHGSTYKKKRVGCLGDAAIFSFYGNKVMTTGEGGMVVTKNEKLNERLRFLRDHAMDANRRYWHPEVGYNYRITNLQAAIGVAQIERYDELSKKRNNLLSMYKDTNIEKRCGLQLNPRKEWANTCVWMITAVFDSSNQVDINLLQDKLKSLGVDSRPYFIPNHLMPPYQACRTVNAEGGKQLTVTNELSAMGINLPSSTNLLKSDVQYITDCIENALS